MQKKKKMNLLRNRIIAITGSSSGIGRAIAVKCAQQGASLLLHHLGTPETKEDAELLLSEVSKISSERLHTVFGGDLTAPSTPKNLVQHAVNNFGRLDTLVNNAGICAFRNALEVTPQELQKHTDINQTATWLLTQAATKQMVLQSQSEYRSSEEKLNSRGGASVVTISSITAQLGSTELCHYASGKAALLGMSTSFASAFGRYGIRYNCVLPGTIETSMNRANLDEGDTRAQMSSRVPLGRLGRPEDIAGAVVYLASEELSGYVSGQWMLVDGGASIFYQ